MQDRAIVVVPDEDHSYWWRNLLGPTFTEELISQAHGDIEADKERRSKVRKDMGSKKKQHETPAQA